MNKEELMILLQKRANGFSYEEVTEEYVAGEQKSKNFDEKSAKTEQKTPILPENCVSGDIRGVALFCQNEDGVIECAQEIEPPRRKRGRPRKCAVHPDPVPSVSDKEKGTTLVLAKRKVTKHYVEPDMNAIKILIDLEKGNSEEQVSTEELVERRRELLKKIKSELDELEK